MIARFAVGQALRAGRSRPCTRLPNVLFSRSITRPLSASCRLWASTGSTAPPDSNEFKPFRTQLNDPVTASFVQSTVAGPAQTLTEKIVQRFAVGLADGQKVLSGDYVTLRPHRCMTHDNSWPVATKFQAIGATEIHDRNQIVMTLDHDVQNKSETNLKKYQLIEKFAASQGVDFYPAGHGIGHQVMVEEGYAWPGTVVVASDSHSNMYGGVGCLGTPVVRTDAASIWATGRTWWQIPPVARVNFLGVMPKGVTGKDVIVALCGLFASDDVLNHAIEFTGSESTLASLPIDDRLTIANMTTEWGALSGLFPIDARLRGWLRARATEVAMYSPGSSTTTRINHARLDELLENPVTADAGAKYAKDLYLDLSSLSPYVAGPNSVKVATPLAQLEAERIKVNKAYLISCTNARRSDIAAAARVFREAAGPDGVVPKICDGTTLYIAAASLQEQAAAEEAGDWDILQQAGATVLPSGCGPCIGLGTGLLQPGEVGISASNRNFKGRMGSVDAKAYLASPEVVAASALNGYISGPGWFEGGEKEVVRGVGAPPSDLDESLDLLDRLLAHTENIIAAGETAEPAKPTTPSNGAETAVLPGFPAEIKGEVVFCNGDNINTDGIYPGKYTYQDGVTAETMAQVVMENYDTEFAKLAKAGDIVVAGYNFGCGSSREQAATALLAKGIPLVVAASFGNIFSRNSINNGLLGIELPRLTSRLREVFGGRTEPTIRTGWSVTWDVRRSLVRVEESGGEQWEERVGAMPPNVQEIVARGGLESWVKGELEAK